MENDLLFCQVRSIQFYTFSNLYKIFSQKRNGDSFVRVRPTVVKFFFGELKMDGLQAKSTIKISEIFMI